MATPVEVSCVKRRMGWSAAREQIEGLGGMWRDRPWYMSAENLIREIERPNGERQWDFYVQVGDRQLPIVVSSAGKRMYLAVDNEPDALLKLPEWRREDAMGWPIVS